MSVYIGFDYGLKRIGVAIGDSVTRSARALTTTGPDWTAIGKLLKEWRPAGCVVGLPLGKEGDEQRITAHARAFAAELAQRFAVPVALCDERYSTLAAQQDLREARAAGHKARRLSKDDEHAAAARQILQDWLGQQAHKKEQEAKPE